MKLQEIEEDKDEKLLGKLIRKKTRDRCLLISQLETI